MSYLQLAQSVDALAISNEALRLAAVDAVARSNTAVGEAEQAATAASAAAASVINLNKVNKQFPFPFVAGQAQYDVGVISGDNSITTAGLALWVESGIEYAFTINDAKKFTLDADLIAALANGAQMRIIVNARFDDLVSNFDDLQDGFTVENAANYQAEKTARTGDYYTYLQGLQLEPAVPYVADVALLRPTQTVTQSGVLYRPKAEWLPFATTTWVADVSKFTVANDMSLRQELAAPSGAEGVGTIGAGAGSVPRTAQAKFREYVTVADKGGISDGVTDCTTSVRAALDDRINGWSMVRFTAGKWKINNQIRLQAKTVIVLEAGAEIIHGASDEMLFINGIVGNTTYATGYDGDGDIYFFGLGGTVNINAVSGYKGMARFAHAKNIWVQGLKVKNGYRAHNIEFNSCNNFRCEWNVFSDHLSPVGESNFETVQIDHAVAGGLPEFGAFDDTPCINGWIRNNEFKNVWSAFGSHSDPNPAVGMHNNIHFHDNIIDGFRGMPFKLQGFTNSSALRNVMKGAGTSARGPVIWSSRHIDAGFGELDMQNATSIGWTVGNSSVTYFSEDVDIHDVVNKNCTNNPIFYTNCTRGNVKNNIQRNCSKSIFMSTAFDINVEGNRHDGGTAPYLVEVAATSLRISLAKNTGTYTTAKYNTDSYLTQIDGETKLASGTWVAAAVITLSGPINNYRSIILGSGVVGSGTFLTQAFRGFTSVGFQVGTKLRHLTASGLITINVDSDTQLTITSLTGAEALRFIYGVERRE